MSVIELIKVLSESRPRAEVKLRVHPGAVRSRVEPVEASDCFVHDEGDIVILEVE
ncbi:MAG: hypothetical protein ACYTEQ_00910 [Planctomycetota bacterium]|jgi:hypothetical protein